jgi:hypothetical protein
MAIYVYLTNERRYRVRRYQVSAGDPNMADPSSMTPIISVDEPFYLTNHKAGWIAFGPDGMLYVVQRWGRRRPNENAQMGDPARQDAAPRRARDGFRPTRRATIRFRRTTFQPAGVLSEIWRPGRAIRLQQLRSRHRPALYRRCRRGPFEEIDLGQPGGNYG